MLKIKLLRMSRNLSQWELSQRVGVSQGRYSMIERGLIEPTETERIRLAHVLGANPAMLFRAAIRSTGSSSLSQAELVSA
ncbi:MAG: helix-turn-helix domain-containing protein [Nitrospira sp. CR2.1]|nr:helix-turn-helix domain-containing protein [Nitrospira sp. CR2.1]